MGEDDITAFLNFLLEHKYWAGAAIAIGLIVRLLKSDATFIPATIPARWRPPLAIGLGIVAGVVKKIADGTTWRDALLGGLAAAASALLGHKFIVDTARGGRDLGESKEAFAERKNIEAIDTIAKSEGAVAVSRKSPPSAPMVVMMFLLTLATISVASVVLPGCAAVISALPMILNGVTAASFVLEEIQHFVQRAHIDPLKQQEIDLAIAKCRTALLAAMKLTTGAEHLTQEQTDAAFADFAVAYTELEALVAPLGVTSHSDGAMLKATRGGLSIPKASALIPRVSK